jgi:hypothetical protein
MPTIARVRLCVDAAVDAQRLAVGTRTLTVDTRGIRRAGMSALAAVLSVARRVCAMTATAFESWNLAITTALSAAADRSLDATGGYLGRVFGIALDDAELAGVIAVALAADELAVVAVGVIIGPLGGAGSVAAALRALRFVLALAFLVLPLGGHCWCGRALQQSGDKCPGGVNEATPRNVVGKGAVQSIEPMLTGHSGLSDIAESSPMGRRHSTARQMNAHGTNVPFVPGLATESE